MRKAPNLITYFAFALIGNPVLIGITAMLNLIPFIGTGCCVILLVYFANCIEKERKGYFPDVNIALFTACAYGPGLAASIIFCSVISKDAADHPGPGYGGLIANLLWLFLFGSQLIFALIGSTIALSAALNAPKKSKLPKLPYCSDQIDPDEFFNDKGE